MFLNEALDHVVVQAVVAYTEAATTALKAAETRYKRIYESDIIGVLEW